MRVRRSKYSLLLLLKMHTYYVISGYHCITITLRVFVGVTTADGPSCPPHEDTSQEVQHALDEAGDNGERARQDAGRNLGTHKQLQGNARMTSYISNCRETQE